MAAELLLQSGLAQLLLESGLADVEVFAASMALQVRLAVIVQSAENCNRAERPAPPVGLLGVDCIAAAHKFAVAGRTFDCNFVAS